MVQEPSDLRCSLPNLRQERLEVSLTEASSGEVARGCREPETDEVPCPEERTVEGRWSPAELTARLVRKHRQRLQEPQHPEAGQEPAEVLSAARLIRVVSPREVFTCATMAIKFFNEAP